MHRPGTPSNPGRRPPNSSPAHDGPGYQTALRGASLAFQGTGPSPGTSGSIANSPRNNGALIAATRISRQATGNSVQDGSYGREVDHGAASQRLGHVQAGQHHGPQTPTTSPFLKPPGRPNMASDPRTTSFIAATLAASRSASPSPSQLPHTNPYAQHAATRVRRKNSAASSVTSLDLATDTRSIPPTNALISMFERSKDGGSNSNTADPVKRGLKPRPFTPEGVATPSGKPEMSPSRLASTLAWGRATSPPGSIPELKRDAAPQKAYAASLESKKRPRTPPATAVSRPETKAAGVPAQAIAISKPRAATPPRPIGRASTVILSPQPRRAASHKMVHPEASPAKEAEVAREKPPPPAVKPKPRPQSMHEMPKPPTEHRARPHPPAPMPRRSSSTSSLETFVSASSGQASKLHSPPRGRSHVATSDLPAALPRRVRPTSAHSTPPGDTPRRRNPVPPPPRRAQRSANTALTSLTDATMAGILASSRMPVSSVTPSPRPPSAPPSRKQTPHMRQTLRKPPSSSDDEESKWKARHRTKPLQSKKKHAHHEGARRRWREEITARERRRYEGVWASNRGYLLNLTSPEPPEVSRQAAGTSPRTTPSPSGSDLVVNVVVRDLWSRSRLPVDELAEVWDLVDRTGRGALDKTEFVVGLWLIDQRLRGRKIPQKVMDSVWASARGVSVKGPPKEKKKTKKKHKL